MSEPIKLCSMTSRPLRQTANCVLVLWGCLLLSELTAVAQERIDSSKVVQEVRTLELGKPIERELAGGEHHYHQITLASGQYVHVVIDRRGIDVVVTLFGPDGKQLTKVDSPNGAQGPEPVKLVAESSGNYRLEVRSLDKEAAAGRYEVRIEALRNATQKDKSRVAADRATTEGRELEDQGTAESLQKAIEKYEEALSLWRAADDRRGEAEALENLGYVSYSFGEYQRALEYYGQAIPVWQAAGDRRGEAGTLNYIGLACSAMGENEKALDYYNHALSIRRAVNDLQGEANTLNNIGAVYWALDEYRKALDYYHQALQKRRDLEDRRGEAETLNNIGAVYRAFGENHKALEYWEQALKIRQALGDRFGEGNSLYNLGDLYDEWGEKQKALDHLNLALRIFRAIGSRPGEAHTLKTIGMVYHSLGESQKALDYLNQALQLFQAMGNRYSEAYSLTNTGKIYEDWGEKQKALDYYNQALSLTRALGDRAGQAHTLINIGKTHADSGDKEKALEYYREALSIFQAVGDRAGEAYTLNYIGKIYSDLGEPQEALAYFNQALPITRAVGDRTNEASALLNIARVQCDHGDLVEARAQIELALDIIESLRTKVFSLALRASYFASVQKYYEFYIDLLMKLHKSQPSEGYHGVALQVNERARARSLLEFLAEAHADIRHGVDVELLDLERTSQQQLSAKEQYRMQLSKERKSEELVNTAEKEIRVLLTQYEEVEAKIRVRSPRYAALTQPQPLSMSEIQKLLDDDTMLLEYALGEERSFLWTVTPTTIGSFELTKRNTIESLARHVYELLTARNQYPSDETGEERSKRIATAEAEYYQAAAQLSQMLLSPVADQLGAKRLLIVCDGALQYIPFGGVPVPQFSVNSEQSSVYSDDRPLVLDHEIVSLPSASVLAVLRQELTRRKQPEGMIAVLADPVFSADDPRIKPTKRLPADSAKGHLAVAKLDETSLHEQVFTRSIRETGMTLSGPEIPRLPYSREEAKAILASAPPEKRMIALDFQASYATATSAAIRQYRMVHFATHSLLNSVHPELSGIVLSLVDERGRPQNGFLRLHEIYNMNLSADLVVLSACQTALGKEVRGEGLVGLTRGFMYAGALRVVASLWKVDDQATAELMKHFYKEMLKERKLPPAAALRAAQTALWKTARWKSPYYWAAFVMQGDWQ